MASVNRFSQVYLQRRPLTLHAETVSRLFKGPAIKKSTFRNWVVKAYKERKCHVQMTVDEMSILTTIFVKLDRKKVHFPNAILGTKLIINLNRSSEMVRDVVEFAIDYSTSSESITALRAKIQEYLASKPHLWSPDYSVKTRDIMESKLIMNLCVVHTVSFQDFDKIERCRLKLVDQLKTFLQELEINCTQISCPPPRASKLSS